MKGKLLIIDDDRVFCNLLTKHFGEGYAAMGFSDPREAVAYLGENTVDVVLTDLSMPVLDGMEVLRLVKSESPDTDVIIMTAFAKVETAVEAMKKGAYDYIIKPFSTDELDLLLKNLFEKRRLIEENVSLKRFIDVKYRSGNIIGESEAAKNMRRFIDRVSRTDYALLITGESGTGKELVARAIHFSGKRKDRKIFSVHCAALPEPLLEREIFGYEKGAFPDAREEKKGLFEEAEGGTVVLDGIGDMGLSLQAKLLMALENGTVRRIGGEREIPFDAMVIVTTSDDLKGFFHEGKFRRDLYYRLDMVSLRIPPLRERKEDIPLLAEHFFTRCRAEFGRDSMGLSQDAVEILTKYDWPGNVRELKGLIAKICLLEESNTIRPEHLLARLELPNPLEQIASFLDSDISLTDIEKNLIAETLKKTKGNMTKAAKLLNISYDTLRYRIKKFGIK